MRGRVVNASLVAIRADHPFLRLLAVAAASGLILSTAGAFDTEAASFAPRLTYWVAIAGVSIAALELLHQRLARLVPQAPPLLLRVIGWAVLALPLNMLAVLSCKLLFGGWPSLGGFLLLLPGMASILAALQFVLTSFARTAPMAVPALPVPPPEPACGDELRLRLPLPLRSARIAALEAQDHYVRAYTSAGQALVRGRLRDLIEIMEEEGVQPHRSWWVARSAIVSMRRENGRTMIVLEGGQQVPVSRSARSAMGPLFGPAELS
jgi:hypothetical protein